MTIPELAKYFTTIWTKTIVPTISNLANKDKENADSIVKAVGNIYIPKEVSVDNFPSIEPLLEAQNATTEAVKSIPETKVDLTGVTKQLADIVSAVKAQETVVNLTEKEVDTKGIVSAIMKLEKAIKALPAPEKQQFIDYSDSLKALRTALETRKSPDLTKIEGLLGTLANTKDIQVVVDTLGELIGKEETVYPFKFDDDGNLLTAPNRWGGGGGGGGIGGKSEELLQEIADNTAGSGGSAYTVLVEEASSTVTYVGEAPPGSGSSSAVWRIKKILESGGSTTVSWADGVSSFTKVWDNRASFSYS